MTPSSVIKDKTISLLMVLFGDLLRLCLLVSLIKTPACFKTHRFTAGTARQPLLERNRVKGGFNSGSGIRHIRVEVDDFFGLRESQSLRQRRHRRYHRGDLGRLDDDAQDALRVLTKSGRSQSAAVREALIALARSRRRADLASEAERLSANRGDRAEKKRVATMMESLREAG